MAIDLLPPIHGQGRLVVRWTSTEPPGTVYELYLDGRLAWSGRALEATIPAPDARVRIVVIKQGDPPPPVPPLNRAVLSWTGGTYLDPSGQGDVAGFRIYGETKPSGGINYASPIGDQPIGGDGVYFDGFGLGGFGEGGYGLASSRYTWTSGVLASGAWSFGVKAYDAAGNESTAVETTVTIVAAPNPPGLNSDRLRLTYEYDQVTGKATLHWLPSPE